MKVAFLDFWKECVVPQGVVLGFNEKHNMLLDMIRAVRENVEVTDPRNADVLFYSVYSKDHQAFPKGSIKKVFFTGENVRPDYNECDYSLSFDWDEYGGRNIHFPLWMMQIDWFGKKGYGNPQYVFPLDYVDGFNPFKEKPKDKFCSSVFNNAFENRLEACARLSAYKEMVVYGNKTNNWFYGEDRKLETICQYKFNLCFENASYPGYNTEKLIHARVAGCIPLYYGSKEVEREFNRNAFINRADYSIDEFMGIVKEIDRNSGLYRTMLLEPLFKQKPDIKPVLNRLSAIL